MFTLACKRRRDGTKIPLLTIAAFLFTAIASPCNNQGSQTNSSSCEKCSEYVLANGTVRYTNPTNGNFGPRQEGSQAIFACDVGYQLSGASNMTCRDGQWIGAIPGCQDIDECDGVECGGNSRCTNGIGQYICECAEGWSGGGVNETCEKGHCRCTGHQGSTYGETCTKHDIADFDPTDAVGTQWMLEPWCYIPCDRSICPGIPRTASQLWRSGVENVSLCYSYENCGGVDFFTDGPGKRCLDRGGFFHDQQCTCDLEMHRMDCIECGNREREGPLEECDDGNTQGGDGCDSSCKMEEGYTCHARDGQADKCTKISDKADHGPDITIIINWIVAGFLVFALILGTILAVKIMQCQMRKKQREPQSLDFFELATYQSPLSMNKKFPKRSSEGAGSNDSLYTPEKPMPLEKRTFANSNYKRFYIANETPKFQHELLSSVNAVIKLFARRLNPLLDEKKITTGVNEYMTKIQQDAFENNDALQYDVGAVGQSLWTSSKTHQVLDSMELCSVLNAVIRDDLENEIQAAVIIFRTINSLRRSDTNLDEQSHPPKGETWRGSSFRREHRAFFNNIKGKKYRVPGFLATSNQRSIAAGFAFKVDQGYPRAMWRIIFEYRVQHMSFVHNILVPGEQEHLFAPYSVFTLLSVEWGAEPSIAHEFTIQAACDNKQEDEHLPLAPWY